MIRVYLVPKTGDGKPPFGFLPKYVADDSVLTPRPWSARDYGNEDLFLVRVDTDDVEHAQLSAMPDVVALDPNGKTAIDATTLAKAAAAGLMVDSFSGQTEAEFITYALHLFNVKQARVGLDAQAAVLAEVLVAFNDMSKPSPAKEAFLAKHAVVVSPLVIEKSAMAIESSV